MQAPYLRKCSLDNLVEWQGSEHGELLADDGGSCEERAPQLRERAVPSVRRRSYLLHQL
jgi:hypothetical protein